MTNLDLVVDISEAVVGIDVELLEEGSMLGEHILKISILAKLFKK